MVARENRVLPDGSATHARGVNDRRSNRRLEDAGYSLIAALCVLFLPVVYPVLYAVARLRGRPLRGKGAGLLFLLGVPMTAAWALVVAWLLR
jgi:hypothetical protein